MYYPMKRHDPSKGKRSLTASTLKELKFVSLLKQVIFNEILGPPLFHKKSRATQ